MRRAQRGPAPVAARTATVRTRVAPPACAVPDAVAPPPDACPVVRPRTRRAAAAPHTRRRSSIVHRRRAAVAVTALALLVLPACMPEDGEGRQGAGDARQAVVEYVSALNSRSASRLIRVGGVKDEPWSQKEASKILATKGGRGWKISSLKVDQGKDSDTSSARLLANGNSGVLLKETLTVTRDKNTWHVDLFSR